MCNVDPMTKSTAEGAHLFGRAVRSVGNLASEFYLGYPVQVSAKDELRSMVRGLPLDLAGVFLLVGAIWSVEAVTA